MNKSRVIRAVLVLCIALGIPGWTLLSRARDRTTTIEPGVISRQVLARAAIVPVNGVSEVRTQLDGRVLRVHVREGERVVAGQLLAELDNRELSLAVARARAEASVLEASLAGLRHNRRPAEDKQLSALLRAAEQQLSNAEHESSRQGALLSSGSTSPRAAQQASVAAEVARADLDATRARLELSRSSHEVASARHGLEAALAAVELARASLDKTRILAPIAGAVLSRQVDPGDVVRTLDGRTLFEIADPDQIELRAEVEEVHARWVKVNAQVIVTDIGSSQPIAKGRVTRAGASVGRRALAGDPSELRADSFVRNVYIALRPDTKLTLPLGQRLEVRIDVGDQQVQARVPRGAVTVTNGQAFVTTSSGLLRDRKAVELGLTDDQFVQVEGVPAGTKVVVAD